MHVHRGTLAALASAGLMAAGAFGGEVAQDPGSEWTAPEREARRENPVAPGPVPIEEGRRIYAQQCAVCHGEEGRGDGAAAAALKPRPKDLAGELVQSQSDGALAWKIKTGRAPMPSFSGSLPEDERWKVVLYLRAMGFRARYPGDRDRIVAAMLELGRALDAEDSVFDGRARLAALWIGRAEPPKGVKRDRERREEWRGEQLAISRAVEELTAEKEGIAREASFSRRVERLSAWLDGAGMSASMPARLYRCPGDEQRPGGVWLQFSAEPRNPYSCAGPGVQAELLSVLEVENPG